MTRLDSDPQDFIHDSYLVAYEVNCEQRVIRFHAQLPFESKPPICVDVLFTGVQAYHLQYDAFGNIIFEIDEIPAADLYREQYDYISEASRLTGSPGPWTETTEKALAHLQKLAVRGFTLHSSYGMLDFGAADRIYSPVTPEET